MGDIIIKNAAMLFKWWWRFSTENSLLWKKVVCSYHTLDSNMPIANQTQRCNGALWGSIGNVWKATNAVSAVDLAGISKKVGSGESTCFREDIWATIRD